MALPGTDIRPSGPPTRALMSGPNVGFYEMVPVCMSGASTGTVHAHAGVFGDARVVAFGWYARTVSGAAVTLDLRYDPTPASIAGATSMLSAVVADLQATPSGVARATGTTPTLAATRVYLHSVIGAGAQMRITLTAGAQTVTDLHCYIFLWRPAHINANPAND